MIKTKQLEGYENKRDLRFGMVDKNREANGVGDTFKQYSSTYEKTTIIDVKDEHRKHLNRDPIATKKEPLQG